MNDVLDQISPVISAAMLGTLAVFVVFGMLFGMGRGLKRSLLRLAIFGGLLVVAFFLTPVIIKSGLGLNISINGMTPTEWVDDLSNRLVDLMQDQFGNYVTPFAAYIKDYATGIVLAVLNLVLFLALYILIKVVSWFIYAIVAHFVAPKRNREKQKNPKHVWWGLLVGAVQGVVLFVFFMLPINGVIGVVNQAAEYQAAAVEEQPQQLAAAQSSSDDGCEISTEDDMDFVGAFKKVDSALTGYNTLMRYTGLQFLSNKAFEYQLTVRMNDKSKINLVHDINSGLELYMDAERLEQIMNKFEKAFSNGIDLSQITADDYEFLSNYVNKAFDLEILKVADRLLTDLDTILNTPFGDDETYLDGTKIHADSFYGMLIKQNTTDRVVELAVADGETAPTNYAQYAAGLQAIVKDVADKKLDLVRNDILNVLDFLKVVGTYEITFNGLDQPTTVAAVLKQDKFEVRDYLDLATARLAGAQGDFTDGTPFIKVLGGTLGKFSLVKMMGLTNVDNLITYGKMFENQSDESVETFLYDFVPLFFGESAFNHKDAQGNPVKGNWEELGDLLYEVAGVFRDYCTIGDDIAAIKNRLMSENENLSANNAQIQAVIEYLGGLVMTQDYYDAHVADFGELTYDQVKFQKVDQLADAVYDVVNTYEPVKKFLIAKLRSMQDGNQYTETLVKMLESKKENWYDTLHSIVNAAKLFNTKLGELVDVVQNIKDMKPEEMTAKLLDTVTNLEPDQVGEIIYTMMMVPEVGTTVQKTLTDTLDKVCADDINYNEIFGDDGETVKAQVEDLQSYLKDFDSATATEADKDALQAKVNNLWDKVSDHPNLKDYLGQSGQDAAA